MSIRSINQSYVQMMSNGRVELHFILSLHGVIE